MREDGGKWLKENCFHAHQSFPAEPATRSEGKGTQVAKISPISQNATRLPQQGRRQHLAPLSLQPLRGFRPGVTVWLQPQLYRDRLGGFGGIRGGGDGAADD
jgi:hypothetical protein